MVQSTLTCREAQEQRLKIKTFIYILVAYHRVLQ